jgi:hypothetical protein
VRTERLELSRPRGHWLLRGLDWVSWCGLRSHLVDLPSGPVSWSCLEFQQHRCRTVGSFGRGIAKTLERRFVTVPEDSIQSKLNRPVKPGMKVPRATAWRARGMRGTVEPAAVFVVRGPYRWVRHPWYAAVSAVVWSCPGLTADRLLFNVLWTGWICLGAMLEEADLVAEFGDTYETYRRRVAMLIPSRRPAAM